MNGEDNKQVKVNLKLLAAESVGVLVVFALLLFVAAGTIAWVAGWVFLILYEGFGLVLTLWLLKHNPALLVERMTGIGKPNQKTWDKAFFAVVIVLFLAWLILMPLDAVRFGWSHVPEWLRAIGVVLLIVSFYLYFLVFRENAYLSPAIRIQSERGQKVVSTGPYHYVRHPMYAASILLWVGATLLLGSWYGLLLGALLVTAMALRAVKEERVLQAELPGYSEYMTRVRYRFIPHVW
jgi:protein-S-isoprenylcysteine O-methyltransferase Ste14